MEKVLVSSRKRRVVVPTPRPPAVREIQLIDRVEEMGLLRKAADRAVHGEGGVVFLYGEAGIGKTRLARELGAYAHSQGMQVLSGRCPALFRMDGVPPYVLWEEVIKDYLEICTPEQLFRVIGSYPIEVSKLVPELKQKLRTFPQSFPLSPEHSRDRLFEAVSQFFTNISREAPLLVILDDLQWTDQSSLLLMHYLARGVYKESLLILGAYRDTYVDDQHPLSPVLTELNRERLLQSVSLRRMSYDDVSEMIKQILEQDDVPREFCELVYGKTRGNPFFVEEVIKSLKEEKVIYPEEKRWKIERVSRIEFPKTVRSVIKRRISRLDDDSQRVLTIASFVGKDFTFEALGEVTGIEEDKLLEIMEKMLKTGLIKESVVRGEDVFSFSDIMVRDVVYEEVSRLRRRRLHKVVGHALEKVYAEKIDEHFGEVAYHFLEGSDKEKALDYFLKAGKESQKVYAHDEAFSYLQHALELLEEKEGDLEEKVHVVERLGDLKWWMGEADAGLKYWNKSLILWSQLGDKKNIARLHVKIAAYVWQYTGDRGRASEHHRLALEILEKEPESVELARLYEDISHMLWRTGGSDALAWAQKAFKLAKKLGDPEVLVACYNDLGTLSMKSGEFEKAAKYYEQGLKIALENNVVGWSITLCNNLCAIYGTRGEFEKWFKTAQKGSELAKKIGSLYGLAWLDTMVAECYSCMGEMRKAISMFEEILVLDKRTKYTPHIPVALFSLGECYQFLGEWDKSLQYLMEAHDIAKGSGEYQFSGRATLLLGGLFMEMGDYVEAEKYFDKSSNICEKAGDTVTQLTEVFPPLSELYLKKGEIKKAKKLIEKIYAFATNTKNRLVISYAEMLRAMLFREQKNWEQSIQHFEKSLQGYKSLNLQKWYVHRFAELLYEYGLMHLNRNEDGDEEKGYSLLKQALEIYQKMDAKKKIEKIRSRMIALETGRQITEPVVSEVSEVLPDYIPTGYEDLDNLLLGGIPPNYAVVLTSPSCDERDLLTKRFLEAGAKEGRITFHVIAKASGVKNLAEKFQSNFYLFICNPQADKIVKSLPNVFKLKGVENLTDINIALSSAFRKLDTSITGPRRACIEIISDVLLQHRAVQTRRWLNGLIPELKSKGFTTLAIMDPEMHPPQEVRAILDLFEGEINVYEKETEKGLEKFLKIKKMLNQRYLESELHLKKEKLQK
jgi:tetratricopeptide (TPR) repeat protein/KaiC/GvpD/RAD55 family RecA-like ATPase